VHTLTFRRAMTKPYGEFRVLELPSVRLNLVPMRKLVGPHQRTVKLR
jgi:hypothetical protein